MWAGASDRRCVISAFCRSSSSIRAFIEGLDLPKAEKARLLKLTPGGYTGLAQELARRI